MGKVLGGGLPAAAVGGRAELMQHARARRRGLPGGHAVGQPARGRRRPGDARAARRGRLRCAWRRSPSGSRAGLREAAGEAGGHPVQVVELPGLLTVFFSERPVSSTSRTRAACDLDAYAAWCRELLARGVYPPPSQFEAWFPSLAHTPEQIERTVEAAAAAFAALDAPVAAARASDERSRRQCARTTGARCCASREG